jgi:hypothetical protein
VTPRVVDCWIPRPEGGVYNGYVWGYGGCQTTYLEDP